MARGWESKSVEQQQDEAKTETSGKKVLTPEQIAAKHRQDALHLSRQRILQQLQVACNPRHRGMLEAALAELDGQLAEKP